MTTFNPALNFNFASAEATRLAYAERGAEDAVAAQLRQANAEQSKFAVGSTITARYQYKVAEDGSLVPIQTQITTDVPRDERQGLAQQGRRYPRQSLRDGERPPSFNDLATPKPLLSPSDEISIFAQLTQPVSSSVGNETLADLPPLASLMLVATSVAEAVDENGETVQAELLAPETPPSENRLSFTPRAQYSVATLYARNNDVVYNMTPIAQLAA